MKFIPDRNPAKKLPDEFLRSNLRPEIARARAHVAARQLEPGAGEDIRD